MIFILLFFPLFLIASEIYFDTSLKVDNDFMPSYEILNGWKTYYKKDGTNLAFIYNNENLFYKFKSYTIGILREDFYYMKSNQDTAEFIYLFINNGKIKENKIYNINLKLYGYSVNGIKFGKFLNIGDFKLLIEGDLLKGIFMQNGWLKGNAITYSNGNYHYKGEADYYYTHNYLYKLKVKRPFSTGYRLNLKLNYEKNIISWFLDIKNLFGFIKWENLPYSHVYIETDNKDKSKGYLIYKPTVYGIEKYVDYTQRLYPYVSSYIAFKNRIFEKTLLGFDYFKESFLPFIGFNKKNCKLTYNIRFKSINIKTDFKRFSFEFHTNKLNLKKANSLGVGFSYFIRY
jgi:hypothetical protein